MNFIQLIEKELKIKAKIKYLPSQPGDMIGTHAEVQEFNRDFKKLKNHSLKDGIKKFINWYKEYYNFDEQR